jgi:hypothetical protein
MSRHCRPYCWAKITLSQDQLKNYPGIYRCPGCGVIIDNQSVTDGIPLQNFVSLVKSRGSRLAPGLWGN